jgi:hypothetical protein
MLDVLTVQFVWQALIVVLWLDWRRRSEERIWAARFGRT